MATRHTVRSISFPSRSHPSTQKLDEELHKLKNSDLSSASTSGSICSALSCFEDLYTSIDELLNLSSTQRVLSNNGEFVDELLDGSVNLLDVCNVLRDLVVQVKEQARSLQSALRRRKGDSGVESAVATYNSFRRKTKKDAKKLVATLKQTRGVQSPVPESGDHHLAAVIRVLREVAGENVSVFRSVSEFLSAARPKKWSLVAKLTRKGSVACEEQEVNEVERVDHALASLCGFAGGFEEEKARAARRKLEDLEMSIEGIENGLEGLFRRLIKTRTSLLNIVSQ